MLTYDRASSSQQCTHPQAQRRQPSHDQRKQSCSAFGRRVSRVFSPFGVLLPECTIAYTQGTPVPLTSVEAEPPLPSTQPAQPASTPAQEQPSADVLIEMKNVYKSFGSKAILRGANITIRRGEAVGIIGGSGTGKSTTLRIMAGLLMPDSVWLDHSLIPVCHCFAFVYGKSLQRQGGSTASLS